MAPRLCFVSHDVDISEACRPVILQSIPCYGRVCFLPLRVHVGLRAQAKSFPSWCVAADSARPQPVWFLSTLTLVPPAAARFPHNDAERLAAWFPGCLSRGDFMSLPSTGGSHLDPLLLWRSRNGDSYSDSVMPLSFSRRCSACKCLHLVSVGAPVVWRTNCRPASRHVMDWFTF